MGNAISRPTEINALICECGYIASTEADFVLHNNTIHHSHHDAQRQRQDKRFRRRRNGAEIELTIRATEQATGNHVFLPYSTNLDTPEEQPLPPQPREQQAEQQAEQHRLQEWLLEHIAGAADSAGPLDEQTAHDLAEFLADLLEQGEMLLCLLCPLFNNCGNA
jgi:hypothetical protein